MSDGQTELVLESPGQILAQPARKAFWKCRHDDLIELPTAECCLYRTHGIAVAHLAVGRDAGGGELLERRLKVLVRQPTCLFRRSWHRQYPAHDRHGRRYRHGPCCQMLYECRRNDDPELTRTGGRAVPDELNQRVVTERLISNNHVAPHRCTSPGSRRSVAPGTGSNVVHISRARPRPPARRYAGCCGGRTTRSLPRGPGRLRAPRSPPLRSSGP
jgi:hypothetical protein